MEIKGQAGDRAEKADLRVSVDLLNKLMNLAGELVLSRNQMRQGIQAADMKQIESAGQKIDMITSELQEAIMRTRMQPVAVLEDLFTNQVRQLAKDLKKPLALTVEGRDVELDKTLLEAVCAPVSTLIRSAAQAVEPPLERQAAGKDAVGKILLRAYHDAGQAVLMINDDGKGDENQGPDPSTAAAIETLGGSLTAESTPGKGSRMQIKLPLTLAIIPGQMICVGKDQFAVPQANLSELLRIPFAEIKERIEKVGNAEVVRLRGELLPLVDLAGLLGIHKTYTDPGTLEKRTERRQQIADRRSPRPAPAEHCIAGHDTTQGRLWEKRKQQERRRGAVHIAVVTAGSYKYGITADQLLDTEEIVVKPLGRHLKAHTIYSGATILGDGRVALILDILNLAQTARLSAGIRDVTVEAAPDLPGEKQALVTFSTRETEHFAAPLGYVQRIERIAAQSIETVGDRQVIQYRGGALPLIQLSQVTGVASLPEKSAREVIVLRVENQEFGLMVSPPVNTLEAGAEIDQGALKQPAIQGSMIINGRTTLVVDIPELAALANLANART